MKFMRMALTVVGVLALCATLAWAGAPAGDAAVGAAEELEHARQHAMVSADVESLDRIFADNLNYVHSTGLAQSKKDLLDMLARGDIRYVAFRVEAVSYRAYGSIVVGTGVQSIDLASSGKPFTSRSRYTVVYAPSGSFLQLVSYQSTAMPEIVMQEKVGDSKAP